jgi:hypothetical protein
MKITAPAPIRTYIIAGNTFDADAVMDGNYDRTGLPDPLVLTFTSPWPATTSRS